MTTRKRHSPEQVVRKLATADRLFGEGKDLAEIERGVVAKERSDTRQGTISRRWFDDHVLPTFADRVLPFDLAAARALAAYRVPEPAPFDDALIAAIAESAHMTVVARNTEHFEPLGVPCLDPWDASPTVR